MLQIYTDIIENVKLKVDRCNLKNGLITISIDKDTQKKLFELFGYSQTIQIIGRFFKELENLEIKSILNKYRFEPLDEILLGRINRELMDFIYIHKYEIINKLQLILANYRPYNFNFNI